VNSFILLTYVVPALVVLMMTIVGTGLSVEQFKIVTRNSATVLWSSLIGLLLLPAGALIIGNLLASGPEMAGALVLIAACPGGALSNYYCYLVKQRFSRDRFRVIFCGIGFSLTPPKSLSGPSWPSDTTPPPL